MVRQFIIAFICIGILSMSFGVLQHIDITEGYNVSFKIKDLAGTLDGSVSGLKGKMAFDPKNLSATVMDVTLDLSTIKTGIAKRDKDIKTEKVWFDIAKYPVIAFKSNTVSKSATGYLADGMLTMKGVSKKVQIPFIYNETATGGTFSGSLKLDRLDYGVGKSSIMVKDSVEVTITVPVKRSDISQ